jgi:hypothetical protein
MRLSISGRKLNEWFRLGQVVDLANLNPSFPETGKEPIQVFQLSVEGVHARFEEQEVLRKRHLFHSPDNERVKAAGIHRTI